MDYSGPTGREACSETAEIIPWTMIDRLTCDPSVTDYTLEVPARCVQCCAQIKGKTLVDLNDTNGFFE